LRAGILSTELPSDAQANCRGERQGFGRPTMYATKRVIMEKSDLLGKKMADYESR
jgi:hypothetical protein